MPTISKQYFDAVSATSLTCAKALHPSTNSCTKALLEFLLNAAIGSSKFFLFIYTLQAITDWHKVNKNYIKKQMRAYVRSLMFALCLGFNFHGSICLLRWCFDGFYFYTVALSGLCAGLSILVKSKRERSLDTAIFLNFVAETLLRYVYSENIVTKTAFKETLLFMTCSAILMYQLRKLTPGTKVANLWFYYPSQPKPIFQHAKVKEVCTHESSCSIYFYEGFSRYFLVGYSLQLIKYLLPRLSIIISNPIRILQAIFSNDKFFCGLLFGGYVGIYRIVSCILYKKFKNEQSWHPLLAGFFAGTAYIFKPTTSVLAIAFTTILQLLVQQISCISNLHLKLPLREIIFAVSCGIIFHTRFLISDACPTYVKNMLGTTTNGRVNKMYEHTMRTLEHLGKSAMI